MSCAVCDVKDADALGFGPVEHEVVVKAVTGNRKPMQLPVARRMQRAAIGLLRQLPKGFLNCVEHAFGGSGIMLRDENVDVRQVLLDDCRMPFDPSFSHDVAPLRALVASNPLPAVRTGHRGGLQAPAGLARLRRRTGTGTVGMTAQEIQDENLAERF